MQARQFVDGNLVEVHSVQKPDGRWEETVPEYGCYSFQIPIALLNCEIKLVNFVYSNNGFLICYQTFRLKFSV